MPQTDTALLRFEKCLRASVDRFTAGLRDHLRPQLHDTAGPGSGPGWLDVLLAEEGRLRRKARRNAPCYDLNRHIAVRRLIATATSPRAG